MIIIGAGMAGLLAAGMIRGEEVSILERQLSLPNNHSAVLRFRTDKVATVLGIPFKRVTVLKAVCPYLNPVAEALSYSFKTLGVGTHRSVISAKGETVDRYIAPPDLIQQMAKRIPSGAIRFGANLSRDDLLPMDDQVRKESLPIISTMPMPDLMKLLEYNNHSIDFDSVPGININFDLHYALDAYVTLYIPNPMSEMSRVSITGSKVTIECQFPSLMGGDEQLERIVRDNEFIERVSNQSLELLGIQRWRREPGNAKATISRYSKILPVDDKARKAFIKWATDKHNIYSLGRYATWRPGLLLDDLVNDVNVIRKIIANGPYDHRKD